MQREVFKALAAAFPTIGWLLMRWCRRPTVNRVCEPNTYAAVPTVDGAIKNNSHPTATLAHGHPGRVKICETNRHLEP